MEPPQKELHGQTTTENFSRDEPMKKKSTSTAWDVLREKIFNRGTTYYHDFTIDQHSTPYQPKLGPMAVHSIEFTQKSQEPLEITLNGNFDLKEMDYSGDPKLDGLFFQVKSRESEILKRFYNKYVYDVLNDCIERGEIKVTSKGLERVK